MVKYWKSTRRSVQNKIKINNPQKAELQIATLLFLYPFSGYACAEGAAGDTGAGLFDCRYGEKSGRLHFVLAKRSFPLPG